MEDPRVCCFQCVGCWAVGGGKACGGGGGGDEGGGSRLARSIRGNPLYDKISQIGLGRPSAPRHKTHDTWLEVNIMSTFYVPSFSGCGVMYF